MSALKVAAMAILAVASATSVAMSQPFPANFANYASSAKQIAGNIGNVGLGFYVPMLPSWTSVSWGRPNIWNGLSPAWRVYGPPTGLYADYVPGNEFFPESSYAVRCDEQIREPARDVPVWGGMAGGNMGTQHVDAVYACRVTDAPVVDMDWVRANLDANGYTYKIVYTHENHGNARALISWVKACWVNVPLTGLPSNNMTLAECWRGMARLEGAGWEAWPVLPEACGGGYIREGNACLPPIIPAGDRYESSFLNLPDSWKANGVKLWRWPTGMWNELIADVSGFQMPTEWEFHDDWLLGTPTPPKIDFPPIPPYAGAGDPGAVNIGSVSDGVGTGASSSGTGASASALPFDYAAFCNSPSKDGSPRSPLWTQNCLKRQP